MKEEIQTLYSKIAKLLKIRAVSRKSEFTI